MNTRLFVYGTLRGHALLQRHATFLGSATTNGVLYNLGSYPGLVQGELAIPGELYEIAPEQWDSVIAQFDDYEGDEYVRSVVKVKTAAGELDAWSYQFTGSTDGFATIPSWPPL